ncbi:site-specific integrase, partial [Candidatus Parcubacteria bacterium]
TELRERERHLKTPVVLNVCEAVVEILASKGADRWNEDLYASFCRKWGLSDDDGNPRVGEQELFRINVALCHVLRLLRKQGLKIGHWPVVPLRYRQNLAFEYDGEIFSSLWRFERLVARLVSRKPNFGMKSEEVCARLVLAAIALDGIVFDNADGRLAGLRADDVKLEEVGVIRLPTRSGKRPKHFYIGGYTGTCLKILLPRARRGAPIFPQTWQSGQGKKKTERRRALEALILRLWNEEFPYEDPPQSLDVCYWLRASRMSLALGGMPALLLANLAGKIRGAQFPHWNESIEGSKSPENERECMRLVELHALFPDSRQGKRKAKLGSAKRLRALLHRTREDWEKENADRNERILLDWLIWLAENKRFSDMTLSTFRGHVYVVANRIFPLPVEKSLDELSVEDWETIGRRLVTNDDLAPSTRRTAMTHLRRLHEFLSERGEAPPVDFGRSCFKVPREVAECGVPFPHEVDALLDLLDAEGKEELWLATVCSFYLGLRCEEIVHLRRADVQDGYRLSVRVSKLLSSRRTIPYNLLLPEPVRSRFEILMERTGCRDEYLLRSTADPFLPMAPWQLSKAMGR